MRVLAVLILSMTVLFPVLAQEQTTQQQSQEEVEKQKAEWSKNAFRLLDQVIDEAQSLRLPENRVRVQISAADMLWDNNETRARSLFSLAADGVTEMMRTADNNPRQQGNQIRRPSQLRQELVLTVARHDAQLAYQLLAVTKPPVQSQTSVDPRNPRAQMNSDDNIEQTLLVQVAALDPKLAVQNAEQMLEKGQFPRSLADVITRVRSQDKEAAAKLTDKVLKKLQSANMLANSDAGTLALGLLAPGPNLQTTTTTQTENTPPKSNQVRSAVLDQSSYTDLLSSVVDSALKAMPQSQNNQRGPNNQRGRGPNGGGGQQNSQTPPTEAQTEQNNARRLLGGLQQLLPQLDLYLPSRAQSVRQKMTEVGMGDNARLNMAQAFSALQQGNATSEALLQVAATVPAQMQPRLYQQAALMALDEGNIDRAKQIATDHLQANVRDSLLQRIELRQSAQKAEGVRIDEIRQSLARLQSDNERLDLLLEMVSDLQKSNPKVARQLLEEARQLTNHRATSYENFEQQLKVAHAFATIEPARSFDVLDPGISQLNELLAAAAVLNGFEVNIFRDGELPLQGGGGLSATVSRFGQELSLLARTDFERSETLAGRFQLAEPRILTRLSIVQGLLGVNPTSQPNTNFFRGFGQNSTFRQE